MEWLIVPAVNIKYNKETYTFTWDSHLQYVDDRLCNEYKIENSETGNHILLRFNYSLRRHRQHVYSGYYEPHKLEYFLVVQCK